jgi:hypothetical protein
MAVWGNLTFLEGPIKISFTVRRLVQNNSTSAERIFIKLGFEKFIEDLSIECSWG